ncbi:MAG: flippase [Hungatella sp.]|nr:flippase [Hungatella sp.]
MQKTPSLKHNFIMNTILSASSFLFPLITFPYISRILLPEGNGQVTFATSLVSYFSMAAALGIPTYGIRICAQIRDNQKELSHTVCEIFIINLITTLFTYIIFFITINVIPRFRMDKTLFLVCGSTIFFNLLGMEWLYKALEQYKYITIRSIIFKCIAVILMFMLVHSKEDYIVYAGITVLASTGSNILNFINVKRLVPVFSFSYRIKRHLKPILIFFTLTVTTTIYTNLDIIMLGFISGDAEVGYYNAAVKVKFILTTLVTSLGAVLLPRISYYIENGFQKEYLCLIRKAFDFVIFFALPLCIYFIFTAKESILFLSGDAYSRSVIPMQIIMPAVFFIGLTNIIGIQLLVPLGKEKLVVYSTCAGALVNIGFNTYFIPICASAGAALGTVAAELTVLILQLWFIRSMLKEIVYVSHMIKALVLSVPAFFALLLVHMLPIYNNFLYLIISFLCFGTTYFITLLAFHKCFAK